MAEAKRLADWDCSRSPLHRDVGLLKIGSLGLEHGGTRQCQVGDRALFVAHELAVLLVPCDGGFARYARHTQTC